MRFSQGLFGQVKVGVTSLGKVQRKESILAGKRRAKEIHGIRIIQGPFRESNHRSPAAVRFFVCSHVPGLCVLLSFPDDSLADSMRRGQIVQIAPRSVASQEQHIE
ncbi:hypothetical protein CK221_02010 [Mesorhizobium sp. WSM3868]|nr:hypothetical protein CK221_02010 [Mesorhizobium sp. WSM3868]